MTNTSDKPVAKQTVYNLLDFPNDPENITGDLRSAFIKAGERIHDDPAKLERIVGTVNVCLTWLADIMEENVREYQLRVVRAKITDAENTVGSFKLQREALALESRTINAKIAKAADNEEGAELELLVAEENLENLIDELAGV